MKLFRFLSNGQVVPLEVEAVAEEAVKATMVAKIMGKVTKAGEMQAGITPLSVQAMEQHEHCSLLVLLVDIIIRL